MSEQKEIEYSPEQLKEMYENGKSINELGKMLNITYGSMHSKLKSIGTKFRLNNRHTGNKRYKLIEWNNAPDVFTDKDVNIDEDIETYLYK